MDWITIEAKTVEDAIERALDGLGVARDEAEIEVVEEPKQGLFGWTRGTARVRARVAPRQTRARVERGRKRRRDRSGAKPDTGSSPKKQGTRSTKKSNESAAGGAKATPKPKGGSRQQGEEAKAGNRDQGRGGSKRNSQAGSAQKGQGRKEPVVEEVSVEDVAAHVEQFLGGLSTAFGYGGDVEIQSDDDGIVGMVVGQHGLMVGPKARTLDAIQELTRVSAQRSKPSSVRIKVDVGGYREMRKEALVKFATDVASTVAAEGEERSLEPMSSADRKIVHDALASVEGIETRSVGDDNRRRVVVVPAADTATASDQSSDEGPAADSSDVGEDAGATQDS